MTYEITPEHFGFTKGRKVLLAIGLLACFTVGLPFLKWITNLLRPNSSWVSPPWHWTEKEILTYVLMFGFFALWWSSENNYSLGMDDNSVRVGGRVVRKGHVRYLREFDGGLGKGPRLLLSERGPLWVHFLGGVVVVPKGLPEYEQIKAQVSTWRADAAPHAEK